MQSESAIEWNHHPLTCFTAQDHRPPHRLAPSRGPSARALSGKAKDRCVQDCGGTSGRGKGRRSEDKTLQIAAAVSSAPAALVQSHILPAPQEEEPRSTAPEAAGSGGRRIPGWAAMPKEKKTADEAVHAGGPKIDRQTESKKNKKRKRPPKERK